VKAVQGLIPASLASPIDPRVVELEEMEKQKAATDKKAESLAQRELRCVLAVLVIQTAVVMILTYEKLSWNVMEPICHCITYVYMIARLGFFLKTSKEPSFEGLLQCRIISKQKHLMKFRKFNIDRYNELLKTGLPPSPPSVETAMSHTSSSDQTRKQPKKED
jgi:calcium uniporter protein, mitochondrial